MERFGCLLVLVFVMTGVLAVEGVSPGSYEVDFEAGLEREFVFDFVLDGEKDLRVEGDLAEYVELDRDEVTGRESVVVSLSLPESLDEFGVSEVSILAGDVVGVVKVRVSYPERFVGLELSAPNANVGEAVDVGLKVLNLGSEYAFVVASLEIYGNDDNLIEVFEMGEGWVNVSEWIDFEIILDSLNYSAGDYVAVAKVDYGDGVVVEENVFRLGEFRVGVLNYTEDFYGGRVNRFEIWMENLWNDRIDEVYAKVRVVGSDEGFDSVIVSLEPWERNVLVGYFDARNFKENVSVEISLHYDEEVGRSVVELRYLEGFDWFSLILGLVVLNCSGFLFWRIWKKFRRE